VQSLRYPFCISAGTSPDPTAPSTSVRAQASGASASAAAAAAGGPARVRSKTNSKHAARPIFFPFIKTPLFRFVFTEKILIISFLCKKSKFFIKIGEPLLPYFRLTKSEIARISLFRPFPFPPPALLQRAGEEIPPRGQKIFIFLFFLPKKIYIRNNFAGRARILPKGQESAHTRPFS
jgi:hypothetical protein